MKITKIIACVSVALFVASLTSCNTIAGAGRDIQRGGAAISGAAR